MTIDPPKRLERYDDLPIDCQMAIETEFQELADRAEAAGWHRFDVAQALLELAQNHILGMKADADFIIALDKAVKERGN